MNSLLRSTRFLRQSLTTSSARPISTPLSCRRSLTCTLANKSTSGYGDADQTGDGQSRNPNHQGPRPCTDMEHPGREPVDEGKGTGSGGHAETGQKTGSSGGGGGGREETGGNGKRDPEREGKDQGAQKGDESGVGPGRRMMSDVEMELDYKYGYMQGGAKDEKVEKEFWSGEPGPKSSQ